MHVLRHLVCASLALLAAGSAHAAPSAKAIKKLPFEITKPGRYVLSKSLEITKQDPNGGSDAIRIGADHVIVDLNGLEISTTLAGEGAGISASDTVHDVHILNGSVRGFDDGIVLIGDGHYTCEDVQVFDCKEFGIWLGGQHSAARRCTVRNIGGGGSNQVVQGIRIDADFAEVSDCTVVQFTRDDPGFAVTGIFTTNSAIIRNNSLASLMNAAAITTGIQTSGNSYVVGNRVQDFAKGFELSNAVYLDNATFNCTTKYSGGQDDGGNK